MTEQNPNEARRKEVYDWARGDAALLSALYVKAEQALSSARHLLLDVEGSLLAYWTDLPQSECERLRVEIRSELGDWEPSRDPSFGRNVGGAG